MTLVLILLSVIAVLGTVFYLYLKKKQNNIFPKDKYFVIAQSQNRDIGKFKKHQSQNNFYNFLMLTGLSATSGLLIASITLIMYLLPDFELLGFFLLWLSITLQYILVIPATFIVFILSSLSHSKIHFIFRAGIPLIFNILGASATDISFWVMRLPDQYLTQHLTVTIENQTIVPWRHWDGYIGYAYQVVLHIQNSSQEENPELSLSIDTQEESGYPLGYTEIYPTQELIPTGESDITLNIPIDEFDYLNESDSRCDFTSVAEPLYLFYSVGFPNYKKSIIIESDMSHQLLKLACESKP